jgi:hypothetical protein
MNLYTDAKVDRTTGLNWLEEIPAAVFQSLNAGYIIIFGTLIAGFWAWMKRKGKESSSLFKMAIGTIIMGLGYVFMMFASEEASTEAFGKASMVWIFLAYLFHTIGELSTSPVSLSFITKLAPVKYASIMMGIYFAATGFGNKLAGSIGEASQLEPYQGEMVVEKETMFRYMEKDTIEMKTVDGIKDFYDYPINLDKNFSIKTQIYLDNGEVVFRDIETSDKLGQLFKINDELNTKLKDYLENANATTSKPYHAKILFEKDKDAAQVVENRGDGKNYNVSFVIDEEQSEQEYNTFLGLTLFTAAFGILLLLFLKKLKKLTHGAEDKEGTQHEEQEGFEIADNQE